MITNSDCTIYSRDYNSSSNSDSWTKTYIPECWWFFNTRSSITTEGLKTGDVLTVRIPDVSIKIRKGDVLVKGCCQTDIDTLKDLTRCDYYKVVTANYNTYGDNPHIKVVAV